MVKMSVFVFWLIILCGLVNIKICEKHTVSILRGALKVEFFKFVTYLIPQSVVHIHLGVRKMISRGTRQKRHYQTFFAVWHQTKKLNHIINMELNLSLKLIGFFSLCLKFN